jgi:uncharacterized membrane protein YccC
MANGFWQTVLRFDRAKIAPEIAVRNTIGIVLPLIVGYAMGNIPAGVVAALGAMNVSYSDSRDPYITRARRMLVASVMVAIAVTAGALSGRDMVPAVTVSAFWAFAVGMLVVLGQRAADLGAVTLMTLLVFQARSLTLTEALWSGLLAFGGGVLQTILAIAVWPVKPHEPERRIVASLYSALASVAISPAGPESEPPASGPMTGAQEALASLASDHTPESERLVFLLNQAERIRLSLLTLRRLAKRLDRDPDCKAPAAAIHRILAATAGALQSIGEPVSKARQATGNRDADLQTFDHSAREFRKRHWDTPSAMSAAVIRDAIHQVDALAGRLRAAAGLVESPQEEYGPALAPDRFSRIARLRANLSLHSTGFRHALRVAVCVGVGDIAGRYFNIQRSYWLPMTVAIVLKPDFSSTFSRGILRVSGTLAGLSAATALFYFLPNTPAVDIGLLAAFAFVLRCPGPANYGVLVSAVSGIVVLLIAMTGVDPKDAIAARALNTTAGGALALIAYWIWPTWERTQAGAVLAEMLDSYRRYSQCVVALYVGGVCEAGIDNLRLAARLARSNAEASVARFSVEPGVRPEKATLLNEMLVSSHAFVRAAMAIESALDGKTPYRLNGRAPAFAEDVDRTLVAFAEALREGSRLRDDLPDLRESWNALQQSGQAFSLFHAETDRIATSLNTLREQIARWIKSR